MIISDTKFRKVDVDFEDLQPVNPGGPWLQITTLKIGSGSADTKVIRLDRDTQRRLFEELRKSFGVVEGTSL